MRAPGKLMLITIKRSAPVDGLTFFVGARHRLPNLPTVARLA